VFFASADRFSNAFDYKEVIDKVRIDVSRAHFWDIIAVSALDKACHQVPPRGCGGRGHRPERGQRHHGGPLRHPRQRWR